MLPTNYPYYYNFGTVPTPETDPATPSTVPTPPIYTDLAAFPMSSLGPMNPLPSSFGSFLGPMNLNPGAFGFPGVSNLSTLPQVPPFPSLPSLSSFGKIQKDPKPKSWGRNGISTLLLIVSCKFLLFQLIPSTPSASRPHPRRLSWTRPTRVSTPSPRIRPCRDISCSRRNLPDSTV